MAEAETEIDAKRRKLDYDLKRFKIERILQEFSDRKSIFLEGHFAEAETENAVVILEKLPFNKENLEELLTKSTLNIQFRNDIYGKYECHVEDPKLNALKVSVIHPATAKHVAKYEASQARIIHETPALYNRFTLPFIESEQFDLTWVYNILNHEKEADTIVYEDLGPDEGFVLLPDYKWNGKQLEDLYLICIVRRRDIKSIRDLTPDHVPMLKRIWSECTEAIKRKYDLDPSRMRAYFHYQPSYYHLHIHFSNVDFQAPGINVEKAHLLQTVIGNIETCPDYYSKATLAFSVKENTSLWKYYKSHGYDSEENGDGVNLGGMLNFFKWMGKAKHEPCGEYWQASYAESAWRMALMALATNPANVDRALLVRVALSSAFTCMGESSTDQTSEWKEKLAEVKSKLKAMLPLEKADKLYGLYEMHVRARRGVKAKNETEFVYRKILEFEEVLLQWEELKVSILTFVKCFH